MLTIQHTGSFPISEATQFSRRPLTCKRSPRRSLRPYIVGRPENE